MNSGNVGVGGAPCDSSGNPFTDATLTISLTGLPLSAPTVTGISPNQGKVAGGTSVTITGTNFTGATAVSFGGTAATGFTVNSATQITASAPAHAAGQIDVTVTVPAGTSTTSAADHFTFVAPPTVTQQVASTVLTQNHAATAFTPVTGSGGASPLAYAVAPALPTGLTFNTTSGQITGTPTVTSVATTYTVTVTDAVGNTGSQTFSLTVNSAVTAAQVIPSETLTQGHGPINFTPVQGGGGTSPLSYSVSPALPAGVSLSSSTGAVTGTPTTAHVATTYTVTVTDANNATASNTFILTVNSVVTATQQVASAVLTQGHAATPFAPVTGGGGTTPLSYSVSPTLPAGLAFDTNSGQITGTPTAASVATTYTVTVTDAVGATASNTFSLTVNGAVTATQQVAATVLTQGHAATSFTPVTGGGGTSPLSYSVSPALPAGLALSSSTGAVTGTPTATSVATSYTVTVTDTNGATASNTFSLTVNSAVVATQQVPTTGLTVNHAATSFTPVTGSGGTGTLVYSVSPTLPAGLAFNTANGQVSGTPTTTSVATSYTVTVTDTNSATASNTFSLTVNSAVTATQQVASTTLTQGHAATSFTPVAGSGGTTPLSYSISPSLPAGLSLSSSTGAVTGTPTATSVATSYTVTVTDANSATATATFSLAVNSAVVATQQVPTTSLTVNRAATSFTPVTGSGGTGTLVYSVSPTLPAGLAFNTANGQVSGTPTATSVATSYTVTVTDSNSATASAGFSLTVNSAVVATQAVASTALTQGHAATSFTPVTGSGGTTPLSYSVSPSLPVGLAFNTANGQVSGTPTVTSAATSYTVTVSDPNGGTANANFSLTINSAVTATQAVASASLTQNHAATSFTPVTGAGGTGALVYSVSPTLPAGLSLSSSTGAITGTPTVASAATTYTVTVTDTNGATASNSFSLTVNGPVAATQAVASTILTQGRAATAFIPVTGAGGTAPLVYGVSPSLPAGLSFNTGTGQVSGTPTAASAATTYTVTVTDANSVSASNTFSLTVNGVVTATQAVASTVLTQGRAATAFTPVTGAGGTAPLVYSVSPTLPAGLSLSTSTGQVSGTATAASAATSYTVTVTDTNGSTANASFSLTVNGAVAATQAVPSTNLTVNRAATAFTPVTGSGGTGALTYSVSPSLPAGLSLSTSTGAVTGTPTVASSATNYTVTVTDTNGATANASFSLTVNSAVVATQQVASTVLTQNRAATSFTPVTGSGGSTPLTYSVSPSLPGGLTLSSSTGTITGTPSVASGATSYTVTVADANGATATASFSLTVNGAVVATQAVATTSLTQNHAAAAFTPVTGSGGTAPLSYSVSPGLPAGLSLSAGTGAVTGTPTVASSATNYTVTVTDANGATANASFSLTVNGPVAATQAVASTILTQNRAATTFTPVTGAGGTAPLVYSVSPTLPVGLSLASSTGTITGTPTAASAATSYTVTVTDANGVTATANFSLTVNGAVVATQAVASTVLTQGHAATSFTPVTGSGGTGALTYGVSPSLPAGLSFSTSNGQVSGTATVASTATNYTVTVTDTNGASATASFSLTVSGALVATQAVPTTRLIINVAATAFTPVTGTGGTGALSYAVSPSLPGGLSFNSANGQITGTPNGVSAATTYTVTVTDANRATASATFSLSVSQPIPVAAAVTATTPANIRVAINVGASVTGPITTVAVASNPAHGTAVPSGVNIVYTPATNFFGTDSFTYTATGPGGTSAPATVTVTVTPLAVPVAQPLTASVLTNAPVTLNATASASNGPFTAVAIATPPSAGTAVVNGQNIVYTPVPGQTTGANITFTYTVSNVFGPSAPATVTITVNPIPVPAPTQTIVTKPPSPTSDGTATVSITDNAAGGPFVSATLVSVQPPNAGTVTLVAVNTQASSAAPRHIFAEAFGIKPAVADTVTVQGHAFNVVFTPNPAFVGTATITYTLANAFAASVPGQLIFVVPPRANVSADADVVGLISAQIEAARRFATAQIGNFNERLEQLHGDGPARSSNGLSVNFGDRATTQAQGDPDEDPLTRGTQDVHRLGRNDARGRDTASNDQPAQRHDGGGDGDSILPKNLAFWTAGSVDFGARSSIAQRTGFNFTTDGVSAGADYRLDEHFTVGIGGGYGHDSSDIGNDGTKSIADSYSVAIYGSYHPSTDTFLDGVLGYGWLSYDSTRLIASTTDFARGHRNGEQSFGSLTGGYEYKTDTVRITPYGRFDYSDSTLDRFSEAALGHAGLTYFAQSQTTLTATLGLKGDLAVPLQWGMFLPFLRAELEHDFQSASRAGLAYADLASGGPAYFVPGDPVDRNHMQLGIGANLKVGPYTLGLSYENSFGIHGEQDSMVRLLVTARF
ncbi:MAG TPA: putative Ig domain-containing protein [Aliidongia sp.]|nr:putative Ig domain-containing protein [Aliidongia sp.]